MRYTARVAAVFVVCAAMFAAGPALSGDGELTDPGRSGKVTPPLPVSKFVTLDPFVVPLIEDDKSIRRQYTVVIGLKLVDGDARVEVLRQIPRIRGQIYPHLYRLVSFRKRKPRLLSKERLRQALERFAIEAAGAEYVNGLVVQQAYAGDPPS